SFLLISFSFTFVLLFFFCSFLIPPPPRSTLFPYTTLFRSVDPQRLALICAVLEKRLGVNLWDQDIYLNVVGGLEVEEPAADLPRDRKSTRLNSSHLVISYAVFCLKKKKKTSRSTPSDLRDRCSAQTAVGRGRTVRAEPVRRPTGGGPSRGERGHAETNVSRASGGG